MVRAADLSAVGEVLRFVVQPSGRLLSFEPEIVIVAGYTGRDRNAVLAHIRELTEIGVPPPESVPSFYGASPELLTQRDVVVTAEPETSGEAEVALLVDGEDCYVTLASDHTDRAAERIDIELSKRMCHKVVARGAWPLSDVIGHWDALQLKGWIANGTEQEYQSGNAGSLLSADEILAAIPWKTRPSCFAVLCGTVPAIGGLRASPSFRAELTDSLTGATLELTYHVAVRDFLDRPGSTAARVGATARAYSVEISPERTAALRARLEALERRLRG
jgi:Protein of unknown function (DUF2848)